MKVADSPLARTGVQPLNDPQQGNSDVASAACAPPRSHPQGARRRAEEGPYGI